MSKYKSYANQGSFGAFQIQAPDETKKIKEETQRKRAGMEDAEKFRRENQRIYLEAQKFVQGLESANREQNYNSETANRKALQDALQRDYDTEIKSLEAQGANRQRTLQSLTEFSDSALKLYGDIEANQERQKRLAAMDILARTGATYDDVLAFQKLDDNLTRQEFAAQDSIQSIFGPEADSKLIDGFYEVYKNRNTKRWFEHQQLLQNTANGFPEFIEQAIVEQQQTGQPLEDVDAFLTKARRDFMEAAYVDDRVRPEVLQGAGVYTQLQKTMNAYRTKLLTEKRQVQEAQFKEDRIRAFNVVYNKSGVAGLIQYNSQNPSAQKRDDLAEYLSNRLKDPNFSVEQVQQFLDYPGGGSNGQTFRQAFAGTTAMAKIDAAIATAYAAEDKLITLEDKRYQRDAEQYSIDTLNELGLDQDGLTDDDYKEAVKRFQAKYPGLTSKTLEQYKNLTNEAQQAERSQEYMNELGRRNMLTEEIARNGVYRTTQEYQNFVNLGINQDRLRKDPKIKGVITNIKAALMQPPEVQVAFQAKLNTFNLQRTEDFFERQFYEKFNEFQMLPGMTYDKALDEAERFVLQKVEASSKNLDKKGFYKEGMSSALTPDAKLDQRVKKQVNTIDALIVDFKGEDLFEQLATNENVMDADQIGKSIDTFGQPGWETPAVIRYIGEQTGKTPFEVLGLIAPHIGKDFNFNNLSKKQLDTLGNFEPARFQPIRSRYPTTMRRSRANVQLQQTGNTVPLRPSMIEYTGQGSGGDSGSLEVVQYVSGDPAIKGRTSGRIVYDPRGGVGGHGGNNYHNHYQFATQEQAARAKAIFDSDPKCKVSSYLRPHDHDSAHSQGTAVDVAPGPSLPYTEQAEREWSAYCNSLIGFNPNE
ncbi:MAG: hypothetical protein Unbinned8622contig1003_48 [Prokaryotic dsDNA virus sp.]|nr:MAG: hypothetical protein Unbinned8622contig1003_48 [Prokaryotic dsDNA virus sp.]|tara:strand:- start:13034 stop:15649 length:2616 start_codon:yes stop_codon:yes gene_type:complete